jgi:Fucose permease
VVRGTRVSSHLCAARFLPLAPVPEPHLRRRVNWATLRAVWKPLTVLYFLVFIRSIVQTTFAQLLPLYLHRERGFSLTEANYALSLYLTFGAVGGFAGGQMADRFGGGRVVIMISMIGCVPFLALFFLGHGVAAMAGWRWGG